MRLSSLEERHGSKNGKYARYEERDKDSVLDLSAKDGERATLQEKSVGEEREHRWGVVKIALSKDVKHFLQLSPFCPTPFKWTFNIYDAWYLYLFNIFPAYHFLFDKLCKITDFIYLFILCQMLFYERRKMDGSFCLLWVIFVPESIFRIWNRSKFLKFLCSSNMHIKKYY